MTSRRPCWFAWPGPAASVRRLGSWGTASAVNSRPVLARQLAHHRRALAPRWRATARGSRCTGSTRVPTMRQPLAVLRVLLEQLAARPGPPPGRNPARGRSAAASPGPSRRTRPALFGGDHSGAMNGPAKLRLPRVITGMPRSRACRSRRSWLRRRAVSAVETAFSCAGLGWSTSRRASRPGRAGSRWSSGRGSRRACRSRPASCPRRRPCRC